MANIIRDSTGRRFTGTLDAWGKKLGSLLAWSTYVVSLLTVRCESLLNPLTRVGRHRVDLNLKVVPFSTGMTYSQIFCNVSSLNINLPNSRIKIFQFFKSDLTELFSNLLNMSASVELVSKVNYFYLLSELTPYLVACLPQRVPDQRSPSTL